MDADRRAALMARLEGACHQEVDCAIYDHPYVAELREAARAAAALLAAPEREALAADFAERITDTEIMRIGNAMEADRVRWATPEGIEPWVLTRRHLRHVLARLGGKESPDDR